MKEANILIDDDGIAYVGDFGCACSVGDNISIKDVFSATLTYCGPERKIPYPSSPSVEGPGR